MSGREGAAARRDGEIRAARGAALARRGAPQAAAAEGEAFLVCACGAERFGLPLAAVAQVLPARPCTPVPGAAPALIGLIALSGRIVGVVGLARALGRPEAAGGDAPAHLAVLLGAPPLALAVDRVLGIARAAGPDGTPDEALGNEAAPRYAPASGVDPDFVAVDLPRLLRRVTS